jgi:hypothetical protein
MTDRAGVSPAAAGATRPRTRQQRYCIDGPDDPGAGAIEP